MATKSSQAATKDPICGKEIVVIKTVLWPLAYKCKLLSISLENKNDSQVSNFMVSTKSFFIGSGRDTTSGNAAVIGFTV